MWLLHRLPSVLVQVSLRKGRIIKKKTMQQPILYLQIMRAVHILLLQLSVHCVLLAVPSAAFLRHWIVASTALTVLIGVNQTLTSGPGYFFGIFSIFVVELPGVFPVDVFQLFGGSLPTYTNIFRVDIAYPFPITTGMIDSKQPVWSQLFLSFVHFFCCCCKERNTHKHNK